MAQIKAIVYSSNTGFTKEYAELLSKIIGLPAVSVNDHSTIFSDKESVIFLGWICAGKINGLRLARFCYNPEIIVGVGMTPQSESYAFEIFQQNNIEAPFFYVQGGLHRERHKGFYKFMFKMLTNPILKKAKKGMSQLSDEDKQKISLIKNGCSFVSEDKLTDIVAKYHEMQEVE
ncbi:MAG: hypothetical protein HUK15_03370 [Bacteroidales bacterium]|nr:hypothetical protein [Bacteroidales bacterium]